MDYQGLAILLGAVGVLIASVGSFVVQMVGLARQTANKQDTDRQLDGLHKQGNSNLAVARRLSEEVGVMKGKILGAAEERANPSEAPGPIIVQMPEQESPLPVTVVDPDGEPSKMESKKS